MAKIPPPPPPFQPIQSVQQVQPLTTHGATQEMYNYAADLLITKKKSADEVRNILLQQGLDFQTVSTVISALQIEIGKQRKIRAKKDMMYGGGIAIVGLAITLVTYAIASSGSGGGSYFIAWGAVAVGVIQFFKGLINMSR